MKKLTSIIVLIFLAGLAYAAELELPLTIKDATGDSSVLWFGLDRSATLGIDRNINEEELPPLPPSGVFDARFIGDDIDIPQLGLGTVRDIRAADIAQDTEHVFELRYQTTGNSRVTLSWDLPENVNGHLGDLYGGTYLNKAITGQGQVSISLVKVVERVVMTINYTAPKIEILSPTAGEVLLIDETASIQWASQFVHGDVTISLSRDNGATFAPLATMPNTGIFNWPVMGPPSDDCLLKITDESGRIIGQSNVPFSIQYVAAVEDVIQTDRFHLYPNYPNPFNPTTTVEFSIPAAGQVSAEIYSVDGRLVRQLAHHEFASGHHRLVWDALDERGKKVSAGIYFLKMRFKDEIKITKMVLKP